MIKRFSHFWIIVALMMLPVTSASAKTWNWLTLYPFDLEAIVRFDGTDRRNTDTARSDTYSKDTQWEAGVRLEQQGYILDPDIAGFLFNIEPIYTWGRFDTESTREKLSGNFLNYLVQFNLLQGTPGPVGFDISAMQDSSLNTGSLGSRSDNEIARQTASVNWKNAAFPMRLIYRQQTLKQDFRSNFNTTGARRDEQLKTLTLKGQSSKLNMLIEQQSMDDRIPERDQDYDQDRALLTHRLAWGSRSQLRSRFDYYDRTGFNANKRLTIEENVRIQHTDDVFSRSSYLFHSVTRNFKTSEHNGEFELHHQLYNNLSSSAFANINALQSDALDQTRWRAGLESQYNKHDLFGAAVSAGLGFSYQEVDRDSNLGLLEVIDEPHIVTLGGAVLLNRRFIIIPTIIVTNADGTLVYTEGFDYLVFGAAGELTQLQVIPGGRISTGETILVSYTAEALPSQNFSTTFTNYNLGIDLGWVRASHYDRKSDDKLLSGAGESFLRDTRDTVSDLEFNWKIANVDILIGAERRFNMVGDFESTTYTYRQLFTMASFENSIWYLNIFESFTETETLDTDLYNLELSVTWQPLISLHIRPMLGAWKRRDTGEVVTGGHRVDTYITAGLTGIWRYRKVVLEFSYHYNRRTTETPQFIDIPTPVDTGETFDKRQTNENRLMFNLSRRF